MKWFHKWDFVPHLGTFVIAIIMIACTYVIVQRLDVLIQRTPLKMIHSEPDNNIQV